MKRRQILYLQKVYQRLIANEAFKMLQSFMNTAPNEGRKCKHFTKKEYYLSISRVHLTESLTEAQSIVVCDIL